MDRAKVHIGAENGAEAPYGTICIGNNRMRRIELYSQDLEMLRITDADKFGLVVPRYMNITKTGLLIVADQAVQRGLLIDPEGVAVSANRNFTSVSDNNRIVR